MNNNQDIVQKPVLPGMVSYGLPLGILFAFVFFMTLDMERAWHWIMEEFGILENLQVLTLGLACSYGVLIFQDQRALAYPWLVPWITLTMVGCLLLIGEELSWGQHFFGWTTPVGLQAMNVEQETNIHNLNSLDANYDYFKEMIILAILFTGGVHYLLRAYAGRGIIDRPWWLFPTVDCIPIVIIFLVWLRVDGFIWEGLADNFPGWDKEWLYEEFHESFIYYFMLMYLMSLRGHFRANPVAMNLPVDLLRQNRFQSFGLAFSSTALAISIIEGIFFVANGPWTNFQLMIVIATCTTGFLSAWYIYQRNAKILGVVILLLCWDLGVFVIHFLGMEVSTSL